MSSRAQGGIPLLLPSGRRSVCMFVQSVQTVDPNEVHASDSEVWRQKLSFVNGHLLNYYYFCTDSTSPLGWVGQDILDSVLCTCRSPQTSCLQRAPPRSRKRTFSERYLLLTQLRNLILPEDTATKRPLRAFISPNLWPRAFALSC